jgi:hypothetical protein
MHRDDSKQTSVLRFTPTADMPLPGGRLQTILGVTYVNIKTSEGGDLYLTRFGLQVNELLRIENWFDPEWFARHRYQLDGTSTVFRVPTRHVRGRSIELVVKNCRVGEDVPIDTHTLEAALGAEFNSPWEEFSLVMEMREAAFGPRNYAIYTQRPLAIYVPPDCMQLWQSGRSRAKINRILARHPGIDIDILRQYKLIYQWIPGQNVVEIVKRAGHWGDSCDRITLEANRRVTTDLAEKGYWVADMKPQHIIISDADLPAIFDETHKTNGVSAEARLFSLLEAHRYSVIDYELLLRTPEHEALVRLSRRSNYLDELSHCEETFELPSNLSLSTVVDTTYVEGTVQSTGGHLWVVGKNPRLFDYFLPERWRKTALWRLSKDTELSYTITKDGLHLLWTPSRVGESVPTTTGDHTVRKYNNPFELFSILQELNAKNVPSISPRAIYRTGTAKSEPSGETSVYESLAQVRMPDGSPVLREDRNYLMIFGLYARNRSTGLSQYPLSIPRPVGLLSAQESGLLKPEEVARSVEFIQERVFRAGFDSSVLKADDLLVTLNEHDEVTLLEPGLPSVRLHGIELLVRR